MSNESLNTNEGERNMTIERQHNGSLLISDIVNGYYVKKVYYFYSKKEAMKLFREYIKQEKAI
jgi:hypothetical protein